MPKIVMIIIIIIIIIVTIIRLCVCGASKGGGVMAREVRC